MLDTYLHSRHRHDGATTAQLKPNTDREAHSASHMATSARQLHRPHRPRGKNYHHHTRAGREHGFAVSPPAPLDPRRCCDAAPAREVQRMDQGAQREAVQGAPSARCGAREKMSRPSEAACVRQTADEHVAAAACCWMDVADMSKRGRSPLRFCLLDLHITALAGSLRFLRATEQRAWERHKSVTACASRRCPTTEPRTSVALEARRRP